jgi:hypothetical protein
MEWAHQSRELVPRFRRAASRTRPILITAFRGGRRQGQNREETAANGGAIHWAQEEYILDADDGAV